MVVAVVRISETQLPVWSTSRKDQIQGLQDRAAGVLTKCNDTSGLLHKLGWLSVQLLVDFDTAVMVRKTLNSTALSYLSVVFS